MIEMFGKKKTEKSDWDELQEIADRLVKDPRFGSLVHAIVWSKLSNDVELRKHAIDGLVEVNNETKTKIHEFLNSDLIKQIIESHIESKVSHILSQSEDPIEDEIRRRVDAAGIEQVIKWNNVAYGQLLQRIEDAESKFVPYDEIKRRIDKCREEIDDLDLKMYRKLG